MSPIRALSEARRFNVRITLNHGKLALRATAKPPDHVVDMLREAKPGIVALLCSPIRPAGYSDAEWLAAVLDADRLSYPFRLVT
jgi:hypothetical protein